ncbi:MAG: ABC transporter permease subunit [bacterium]|nr:ABC transporter permease subunit [bacterium]
MNQAAKPNIPVKRKKRWATLDDLQLLLLSLPTTIWYLLFSYIPMFGILIAFKKYKVRPGKGFLWSLIHNSPWCGLDNFKFLFSSNTKTTIAMFRNTICYNIVFITLGIVIPVTLAVLISHLYSKKLAKVCQTAIFLPHFLSWVVVGYFVYAFLATKEGLINNILINLGFSPMKWYQKDAINYWPFILTFLNVWKGVGYNMIVYMASIQGIDGSLYEAAVIDGASKHQQTKYITLPLLKPVIIIMFIMAVGRIFNSDFGLFYKTTRNSTSLYSAYVTLDVYVYNSLFNSTIPTYGYASAAGFLQSALGCLTLVTANAIVRKVDNENAFF